MIAPVQNLDALVPAWLVLRHRICAITKANSWTRIQFTRLFEVLSVAWILVAAPSRNKAILVARSRNATCLAKKLRPHQPHPDTSVEGAFDDIDSLEVEVVVSVYR